MRQCPHARSHILCVSNANETLKQPASITRSQMDDSLEQGVLIERWLKTAPIHLAITKLVASIFDGRDLTVH